jgi:hypothetical protein
MLFRAFYDQLANAGALSVVTPWHCNLEFYSCEGCGLLYSAACEDVALPNSSAWSPTHSPQRPSRALISHLHQLDLNSRFCESFTVFTLVHFLENL